MHTRTALRALAVGAATALTLALGAAPAQAGLQHCEHHANGKVCGWTAQNYSGYPVLEFVYWPGDLGQCQGAPAGISSMWNRTSYVLRTYRSTNCTGTPLVWSPNQARASMPGQTDNSTRTFRLSTS